MLLEGKIAIVAGAGPGLGRDVAVQLADHGADLVLGARRRRRTAAVAEEVRERGRRAEVVELDICDPDACREAVAAANRLGGLDILVNNAFHPGDYTTFEDADLAIWREAMEVNLWGTLQMTRLAVPAMAARHDPEAGRAAGGRVIMVNSMSAWRHQPAFGAYTISKAALESATRVLAVELGPHGIRVNGVHPGYIWGDSVEAYFAHLASERGTTADEVYREVASETCLGYLPPSSEIAGSVVFLASDLASPVTGQSLGVNAGHWLH